jgi:hypothetical protein
MAMMRQPTSLSLEKAHTVSSLTHYILYLGRQHGILPSHIVGSRPLVTIFYSTRSFAASGERP